MIGLSTPSCELSPTPTYRFPTFRAKPIAERCFHRCNLLYFLIHGFVSLTGRPVFSDSPQRLSTEKAKIAFMQLPMPLTGMLIDHIGILDDLIVLRSTTLLLAFIVGPSSRPRSRDAAMKLQRQAIDKVARLQIMHSCVPCNAPQTQQLLVRGTSSTASLRYAITSK